MKTKNKKISKKFIKQVNQSMVDSEHVVIMSYGKDGKVTIRDTKAKKQQVIKGTS
jgi:hypothetical protein